MDGDGLRKEIFRTNLADLMRRRKVGVEELAMILDFDREDRKWLRRIAATGLARPNKSTKEQLGKIQIFFRLKSTERLWSPFQAKKVDLSFAFEILDSIKEIKARNPDFFDDSVWRRLEEQVHNQFKRLSVINVVLKEALRILALPAELQQRGWAIEELRGNVSRTILK